jgi:hypothetical protein
MVISGIFHQDMTTSLVHFFTKKILCMNCTGFFWFPSDEKPSPLKNTDYHEAL